MITTDTIRTAIASRLSLAIPLDRVALFTLADEVRSTDSRACAALAALAEGDEPAAAAFIGLRTCAGVPRG